MIYFRKKEIFPYLVFFITAFISCKGNVDVKEEPVNYNDIPALSAIDRKISGWVDGGYYDGAAVMIVKDNNLLFEKYYGGFTDTTSLHVASAGKWVAAATMASLVDQGKLAWGDKVYKFLPEFEDAKRMACMRRLLSHTAGYPDYQPEGCKPDDYQTLKDAVKHIIDLPADTLPGTKFQYGGLSMQVAGRMAEVASGKDWESIFQENIAKPLKMNHSHFTPVSEEPGFNPMLGGGFKTCLKDYIRFLSMIANNGMFEGNHILSSEAIAEMEADQVKNAYVNQPEYVWNARQNHHNSIYGLGLWREEVDESGIATLISSPGWAGAYPWIDRKNNVYGFIITKVNVDKANSEGFSSFYGSAVLPLMVRRALNEMIYPDTLKKAMVQIDKNAALYCEEMGEGEPLILIHGHSLDHTMWDEQFFEFAKKYRVIRYDIRGYGYSSPQTETEQFTHVDDLIKLMDTLKIDKAHIVGLSLGGYIGADMLGLYPERMLSTVLASGNVRPLPKPSAPMTKEESERRDKEIAELKQKGIDMMKREWFNGLMRSSGTQKERMRQSLWNMIYQWDAWQPLHKEVRVIAGDDGYDKLKISRPDIPVMILEGKSENNRFPANPDILKYLPNGHFEMIEDCGHVMNMERPEEFNEKILKFLSSH